VCNESYSKFFGGAVFKTCFLWACLSKRRDV